MLESANLEVTMRNAVLSAGAIVFGICVAGCQHHVPAAAVTPRAAAPAAAPAPPPAPAPAPARARSSAPAAPALTDDELFRRKSLNELNAERPLGDVFFDFQKDDLRDDGRSVLQRDADWLRRWPQTRISIEGHCDERGTAEYNLALGDRRAARVRDYLVTLGIPAERLSVTSYGREAPFCKDSGENCWSQNRRDHFVITAK